MINDDLEFIEQALDRSARSVSALKEYNVYVLYSGDNIVYVGKSIYGVSNRVLAHMEDKVFDCYSFVPTRDEEEMNRVERELIIKHSPIYNGSIKADAEFMKLRDIRKALGLKLAEINKIIRLRGISPAYKDLYRVSDFRMV